MSLEELKKSIIAGANRDAVQIATSLIKRGVSPKEIIISGITKAMEYLDRKCNLEEFCLLELMLAGRAAMDVIDYLNAEGFNMEKTAVASHESPNKTIVLGTIKGDVHEIGKNIAAMILKSYGYKVIDLGKDVPPEDFVTAAIENKAQFIGISSLITTTLDHVRMVKELALRKGLHNVKIIAGGAALQQSSPDYLNVDYVVDNPFNALHYLTSF